MARLPCEHPGRRPPPLPEEPGLISESDLDRAAVDRATQDDRRWFAEHPGRSCRVRPAYPGEAPLHEAPPGHAWVVSVLLKAPGARLRRFEAVELPVPLGLLDEGVRP